MKLKRNCTKTHLLQLQPFFSSNSNYALPIFCPFAHVFTVSLRQQCQAKFCSNIMPINQTEGSDWSARRRGINWFLLLGPRLGTHSKFESTWSFTLRCALDRLACRDLVTYRMIMYYFTIHLCVHHGALQCQVVSAGCKCYPDIDPRFDSPRHCAANLLQPTTSFMLETHFLFLFIIHHLN